MTRFRLFAAGLLCPLIIGAGSPQPAFNDRWPHYSPDGAHIVFTSTRAGRPAPYMMNSDGTSLVRVPVSLIGQQTFGGVAWFSNTRLLYTVYTPTRADDAAGSRFGVAFMSMSTSGLEPEMLYTGINIERPAVPPSQRSIAFEAEHGSFQPQPNIDVETVDLSTLSLHVLTLDDGEYIQAAWSPDGSRIAFACAKGKEPLQICTMRSDGTDSHVVTSGAGVRQWPSWSPDGERIAYFEEMQIDGKTDSTINVVDADGKGDHVITAHSGVERDETPVWAPDGASIAFQTDRLGDGFRIAVVSPDGSDFRVLSPPR